MMQWGTQKADELGVERWLEATPMGSKVYTMRRFGFAESLYLRLDAEMREDND